MGELPIWFVTIQAARYLGVAPWELAAKPLAWQEWALAARNAEALSAKNQEQR